MKRIKIAWSTEREVLAALIVLLLLVVVLCVVAASTGVAFTRTLRSLDRSRELAMTAEDLYRHLLSAETAGRGFIITGDTSYLEPYDQSVRSAWVTRAALIRLIAETPNYASGLQVVMAQIDAKLIELANTVEIRRSFGFEAAQSVVSIDSGESLMGNIRGWLRDLILSERMQIDTARELVIQRVRMIGGLALLLVLLVLLLAGTVYALVRRDSRAHRAHAEGLSAALHRERELNELKSHFIRTVSHEFRTPLAIIQTSTDLVKHYGYRMSEEQREHHLNKLQTQIVRLTSLLEDAMTVQKAQLDDLPYAPAMNDLRDICRQAIDLVTETAGDRRIDFTTSGSQFIHSVDANLMNRALRNLLTNAIQFSGAASTVRVRLSCTDTVATIDVTDEGVGIAVDEQPKLYDLFFRGVNATDVPGTGLGLPVAKSIVDLHGGVIRCQSAPGSGSTFTIELPASQQAQVAGAA